MQQEFTLSAEAPPTPPATAAQSTSGASKQRSPKTTDPQRSVLVIGGGIAGLAAAYYLRKHGVEVTLLERRSVCGGCIRSSLEQERYLVEHGPNSYLSSATTIVGLIRELSLESQVVEAKPQAKQRFIFSGGRLHVAPIGPKPLLRSKLLSTMSKLRLFAEPWVRSKTSNDETVADFVRRRAGREVLEYLVDPFVSGVYAGNVEHLELASTFPLLAQMEREHGSLLRAMRKQRGTLGKHELLSLRWGMGTLPARLEEVLRGDIVCDADVEGLEQAQSGGWRAWTEGRRRIYSADAVLCTLPAPQAAQLFAPYAPSASAALQQIPYAPMAVVHTAFRREHVSHPLDGFGVLIPRNEGVRLLGSIFSSSLFPGRCPQSEVLLTNFIGGATDAQILELENHEIFAHVREGLQRTLGISAEPVMTRITRWPAAIPQYTVGHLMRASAVESGLATAPGLYAAGNYLSGISVSDTIATARRVVQRMVEDLGVWSVGARQR